MWMMAAALFSPARWAAEVGPRGRSDSTSRTAANLSRFQSADRVSAYNALEGLTPAEARLVHRWVPAGLRVLDLGVGTGRTYPALSERSATYIGVDYSEEMVKAARQRFPDGCFVVGDAVDLSEFETGSFDVVVFSYNGLDYLHPFVKRSTALDEIHRVLAAGGTAILSTHNPRAVIRRPRGVTGGPRQVLRSIAVAAVGTARASASLVPTRAFWAGSGYATDRIQGLLTYYATPERLVAELEHHGLQPVEVVPGDEPSTGNSFTTPWTYVAATRAEPSPPIVQRLTGPRAMESVVEDWDRLMTLPSATAFQSRQWFEAWSQHLEPSAESTLLVARDPEFGRVVGVLPVSSLSRRAHQRVPLKLCYVGIAGAGRGAADHLGPVAESDLVGAALLADMKAWAGRRTMLLENLSPRWATIAQAVVGGTAVRVTDCPAAVRPPDGHFADAWSAKMRKNVRRRARRLEELGIAARWVPADGDFSAALLELRHLHSQRWEANGAPGLFDSHREQFLLDFAERCTGPDAPWILLLEQSDRAVAGLLGLRHGRTFSVYKTGWDPSLARMSPGIALGAEAMRWAEDQGIEVFDYLRGPRSHKSDLGCSPIADTTIIRAVGPTGYLLRWREQLSADGVAPGWIETLRGRAR